MAHYIKLFAFVFLFTALLGCEKRNEEYSIGILHHESSLPIVIAFEQGYLDALDFPIKLVELPPADHMPALLSGRVNMISPTSFPVLFGVMAENPEELFMLFPGAETNEGKIVYAFIVRTDFEGDSIFDLAGKKVLAINLFTQLNAQLIFDAAGINESDRPNVKSVSRDIAIASLLNGEVDAVLMDQPSIAVALNAGDAKVLVANPRAKYLGDPYWSGAGAIRQTEWNQNKKKAMSVIEAIDKAIVDTRLDETSAQIKLAEFLELQPEIAQDMGGYYFPTSKENVPTEDVLNTAIAMEQAGLLASPVSQNSLFPDNLYVQSQ